MLKNMSKFAYQSNSRINQMTAEVKRQTAKTVAENEQYAAEREAERKQAEAKREEDPSSSAPSANAFSASDSNDSAPSVQIKPCERDAELEKQQAEKQRESVAAIAAATKMQAAIIKERAQQK